VKCAILARPTKSTGLYLQQAGRILRPWNDEPAIILDHAGCALEHGLPQDDREFSLDGKKKSAAKKRETTTRECPQCCAVLPIATRACPECGEQLIVSREAPAESRGELVEASEDELRRHAYDALCAEANARGYKAGWIFHRFRERFGTAPPSGWRPSAPTSSTAPRAKDPWVDALRVAARAGPRTVSWGELEAAVTSSST
jgi:hypothetical protein